MTSVGRLFAHDAQSSRFDLPTKNKLCLVAPTTDPSPWVVEAAGLGIHSHPQQQSEVEANLRNDSPASQSKQTQSY